MMQLLTHSDTGFSSSFHFVRRLYAAVIISILADLPVNLRGCGVHQNVTRFSGTGNFFIKMELYTLPASLSILLSMNGYPPMSGNL